MCVIGLYTLGELGEGDFEGIGDALGGGDAWSVPSTLDLAEVLGIHALDPVGDLLQRLLPACADLAYRLAESLSDRISGAAAGHWPVCGGGTLHTQSWEVAAR